MIDALIGGKLFKSAETRQSQNGNTYTLAKVRAADGDGESHFVSVIAFDQLAQDALLALDDGDSVTLTGTLKIGVYNGKPSVSLTAHRVMSAYHVKRKREKVQSSESDSTVSTESMSSGNGYQTGQRFEDDL